MDTIGEFARKTGLTPRALRLYEARGLLSSQRDEDNQYRRYSESDYRRVMQLQALRRLGFSLDEIGRILAVLGRDMSQDALSDVIARRLSACREQILALRDQAAGLETLLSLMGSESFSAELLEQLQPIHSPQRRLLMQILNSLEFTSMGARAANEDQTLMAQSPEGGLFIVADGTAGPYASAAATRWLQQQLDWTRLTPQAASGYFQALFAELNTWLYQSQAEGPRSATCVSLLALRRDRAYIAHVGDTRVYRLRQGRLDQLTRDHSPIQRLLDQGGILRKDIPTHPERYLVTSILGYAAELGELFVTEQQTLPGDLYLLVSDGVTRTLSDQEICEILLAHPLPVAIEKLRSLSEQHGEDNASVIAVPLE